MVKAIEDAILRSNQSDGVRPSVPSRSGATSEANGQTRPLTAAQHIRQISEPFRPSSQPSKPKDELHLSMPDPLLLRFSQLRATDKKLPYPADHMPMGSALADRPSSKDGTTPLAQAQSAPSVRGSRPVGPRDMPSVPTTAPVPPPKLPLNTKMASSLPRAPSPIYSPARNIAAPSSITPSRSTARSMTTQDFRDPPGYSVSSVNGYAKPQTSQISKPRFQELPDSRSISAQDLHDRLKSYNILVIDVRGREHFDEGHIYAKSIMCIEPVSLTYGMSFEDLQEKLIFSPDVENQMFDRIGEFDLVVYYDARTPSERFLEGSPKTASSQWLRALYETLVTFNERVQLRRSPAVLNGGLESWIDLMGIQSLQSSTTLQIPQSILVPKPSRRMPHRQSITGGTSSREVRMRRLHQYDPLGPDEKRKWQEKVREEEVESADLREFQADGQDATSDEFSPTFHRTIDDFIRRYPEALPEPISMVRPLQDPRQLRPIQISAVTTVPSRPAPAVSRPSYSGVSEREAHQLSPTSRQAITAQPPLYTPRLISTSLKLPRTGLVNFGVTCYMNGTIQCLSATIDLSLFFLEETWKNYVQVKNWKGSEGIMPDIFANLLRSLWKNDSAALRPKSLRTFCARLNPEWGVDRQQDAKEFLEFFIDWLHEDLNFEWYRSQLRPLTEEEELVRERMPINQVSKIEWTRYSHREMSYISRLFAGQHASRLTCTTCHNTSTTYEAFYSISVEIPRSGQAKLSDCLRSYCQQEMLDPGEEWKCPVCKCQRTATKTIRITRLPKTLVVHFKRFSGSKTESTRKVHTPVDFPIFGLDMQPYMFDTRLPNQPDSEEGPDAAITPPFLYDAYAVMRHIGNSLNGGHYIALVRDAARSTWRKFDDDKYHDFDPSRLKFQDRLQNEQAYIVFYERSRAR